MPKTLDAFIEDKNTNLIRKRDLKRSSNLKKEFDLFFLLNTFLLKYYYANY